MNRFRRIASRGWLGKALSVLTFGYFPYSDVAIDKVYVGKVCVGTILMSLPSAAFAIATPSASASMAIPGATFAMTTPSASVSMAMPNTLIEFEDCE